MQDETLTYIELREAIRHLRARTDALLYYKQDKPTHYIWRTQRDGRVRETHAMREGRMFERNHSPRPGEEYNCRCWAEPVGAERYAEQILISIVDDSLYKWTDLDFLLHYIRDNGRSVKLWETGYLGVVIRYYATQMPTNDGTIGVYRAIEKQILDIATEQGEGPLTYTFKNTYNFQDVLYTFRNSTVGGKFTGNVRKEENFLVVTGFIHYFFEDKFEDVLSIAEIQRVLNEEVTREEAERVARELPGVWVKPYDITDEWLTKFNGTIKSP